MRADIGPIHAIYTHCKVYNVDLTIVHASKDPLVRSTMDTVQQIAFSFNYAQPRGCISRFIEVAHAGMNNRTNLQLPCEIRWSSRANALYENNMTQMGSARPYATCCPSKYFDFIIILVTIENVLQSRLHLTTFIQSKTV